MMKNIASFIFLVLISELVLGFQDKICSEVEKQYVLSLSGDNRFTEEMEKDFPLPMIKENIKDGQKVYIRSEDVDTCVIENKVMMDGLRYSLMKILETDENYIRIRNGLDGTYKTYGPYK